MADLRITRIGDPAQEAEGGLPHWRPADGAAERITVLVPERLLDLIEGGQCNEHQFHEFDLRVIRMGEHKFVTLGTEIPGFGRVQFFLGTREVPAYIQDWIGLDLLAIDVGSHAIPIKPDVGTFKQTDVNGWTAAITLHADLESLDQPLAVVIPADHPLRGWFRPSTTYTLTATVRRREGEDAATDLA